LRSARRTGLAAWAASKHSLAERDPAPCDGPAFRRVTQQVSRGQPPRERSRVLDAEIHPARADRRMNVGGIAAEKHPAALIRRRLSRGNLETVLAQ
jgi:hypothetical protein